MHTGIRVKSCILTIFDLIIPTSPFFQHRVSSLIDRTPSDPRAD